MAVFVEVAEAVLAEIDEVIPIFFVLAELVGHVNDKRTRKQSKNNRPEIKHVLTNFKRVNWEEAVTGIVAVNEVVGEQPEFEAEVVEDAPEDQTQNSSGNKENKQVETNVPDSFFEPEWPQAEAHEHDDC